MSIVAEIIQNQSINNNQKYCRIMKIQNRYLDTTEQKQKQRLNEKFNIAEHIMNQLNITGDYREQVKYIIKKYNLKKLHGKLSQEKIIACICFYVFSKQRNTKNIHRYKLFNQLELDYNIFSTFMINYVILKEQEKASIIIN